MKFCARAVNAQCALHSANVAYFTSLCTITKLLWFAEQVIFFPPLYNSYTLGVISHINACNIRKLGEHYFYVIYTVRYAPVLLLLFWSNCKPDANLL